MWCVASAIHSFGQQGDTVSSVLQNQKLEYLVDEVWRKGKDV